MEIELTQEILKELLHYNPSTGIFTWKYRDEKYFKSSRDCKAWNTRFSHKEAGTLDTKVDGKKYIKIRILKNNNKAHRIAWLYMTGRFPMDNIDHIDGNGLNNSFCNIRDVSNQENKRNVRKQRNNTSGVNGVFFDINRNKWRASVCINNKTVNLGRFENIDDAKKAREAANIKYGFHANHGLERVL